MEVEYPWTPYPDGLFKIGPHLFTDGGNTQVHGV